MGLIHTVIAEYRDTNSSQSKVTAINLALHRLGLERPEDVNDEDAFRDAILDVIKWLKIEAENHATELKNEFLYQAWFLAGYVPEKASNEDIVKVLNSVSVDFSELSFQDKPMLMKKTLEHLRGRATRRMVEEVIDDWLKETLAKDRKV